MCGRFTQLRSWRELVELYNITSHQAVNDYARSDDVRPTHRVPVIRRHDSGRELVAMRWGFKPEWAKTELINARADGLDSKRTWSGPFGLGQLCAIPADGFFEWQAEAKSPKPKHRFTADAPIALAGIWSNWPTKDGMEECCVVIVTEPNELVAKVHPKAMPAMLDLDEIDTFLAGGTAALKLASRSFSAARMTDTLEK